LGIDAGGTYTDAVLIRNEDGKVIEAGKSLTTYPDPTGGIKEVMDRLDPEKLKKVGIVSISTTLSTNTILENTGFPAGLILVGDFQIPDTIPVEKYCIADGGHDSNGEEICKLDIEKIIRFAKDVQNEVNAFAVSSLFSVRNSDHELLVKREIEKITGLPVVCGHDLSLDLGAYERAITAYLNAQLIPVTHKFTKTINEEMKKREINATLLMMKCDGSVVSIEEALEKPIETIFSGPAASLTGAAHLTGKKDFIAIDIGGTSTDVAMIKEGLPEISDSGATVGGWKTRVKALRMETVATGGDSHVYVNDTPYIKYSLGPIRVIPLCRASYLYPGFKEKLEKTKIPGKRYISEYVYPTVFYIKRDIDEKNENNKVNEKNENNRINENNKMNEKRTNRLLPIEKKHLDAISKDFPTSWEDMKEILGGVPLTTALESLVQKRLIQPIGFTPTDALHITNEFLKWDRDASIIGAEKLNRFIKISPEEFSTEIKKIVTKNMAETLIEYLIPGFEKKDLNRVLSGEFHTHFKIDIPVVLIGAPAGIYVSGLKEMLNAEVTAPEHYDVGNAVGAVFGKGIRRLEVSIFGKATEKTNKQEEGKNKQEEKEEKTNKEINYYVFISGKREIFKSYKEALDFAYKTGQEKVEEELILSGIPRENIETKITKSEIVPTDWKGPPQETKILFVSVGIPKNEIKNKNDGNEGNIPDFVKFINPDNEEKERRKYRKEY